MRSSTVCIVVMAAVLGGVTPAAAQSLWTETSTIGYGASALGLAIGACWSCDYQSGGIVILAAGVGGLFLGHRIGGSAEGAARRGERLSAAQLWGARLGTVTGFAALGALVAAVIISSTDGNAEGEDERRLLTYSLVGAGGGVVAEFVQESGLSNEASAALGNVLVERADNGAVRVGLRHRMGL